MHCASEAWMRQYTLDHFSRVRLCCGSHLFILLMDGTSDANKKKTEDELTATASVLF